MKRILVTITLLLVLIVLDSCEEFLDQQPVTEPLPSVVFSDAGTIQLLMEGAYQPLRWEFNPAFGDSYSMNYIFTDVRSDDVIVENHFFQPHSHGFETFVDLTSENVNIQGIWAKYFAGVNRVNIIIQGLNEVDEDVLGAELALDFLGEAQFLRAYYYFELVRNFGAVPLATAEQPFDPASPESIKRRPIEDIFQQIKLDLISASANLPVTQVEPYRATTGAALALLAKAYLYQEKWQNAADAAQAVIDLNRYELEEDYASNFSIENEFGIESIWEINYTGDPAAGQWGPNSQSSLTAQFFSPSFDGTNVFGWSYHLTTPELLAAFQNEGDQVRRVATIMQEGDVFESQSLADAGFNPVPNGFLASWANSPESGGQRYGDDFAYSRKYFLTPEEIDAYAAGGLQLSPLNHKVLRYAEVLLILAEAVAMGASGNGQEAFDQVRARVGLAPKPLSLDAIKLERRLELATEWNRFHDLVRWGDATIELEGFMPGRDELLPIPLKEIIVAGMDASGANVLSQNPGYN
ncbi:MAG: RagB/SusD family nutrient uptake outer membrane protein [Cyclobacteriaceae bacterium]